MVGFAFGDFEGPAAKVARKQQRIVARQVAARKPAAKPSSTAKIAAVEKKKANVATKKAAIADKKAKIAAIKAAQNPGNPQLRRQANAAKQQAIVEKRKERTAKREAAVAKRRDEKVKKQDAAIAKKNKALAQMAVKPPPSPYAKPAPYTSLHSGDQMGGTRGRKRRKMSRLKKMPQAGVISPWGVGEDMGAWGAGRMLRAVATGGLSETKVGKKISKKISKDPKRVALAVATGGLSEVARAMKKKPEKKKPAKKGAAPAAAAPEAAPAAAPATPPLVGPEGFQSDLNPFEPSMTLAGAVDMLEGLGADFDFAAFAKSVGTDSLKAAGAGAIKAAKEKAVERITQDPKVKQAVVDKAKEMAAQESKAAATNVIEKFLAYIKTTKGKVVVGSVVAGVLFGPMLLGILLGRRGRKA